MEASPTGGPASAAEIWLPALRRVQLDLDLAPTATAAAGTDAAREALGAAAEAFVDALAGETSGTDAVAADLLDRAACLLSVVADSWSLYSAEGPPRRRAATALASGLRAHEFAVLEAEITYRVEAVEIRGPARRANDALARLSGASHGEFGVQLALHGAAAEIGTLLVRAAANLEATGRADDGSAAGSQSLTFTLDRLVDEVAEAARQLAGGDRFESAAGRSGRLLCESLRVPADVSALGALDSDSPYGERQHALHAARHAWMALAARQFAVANELDEELPQLWYKREFGSLATAISMGAGNLLCGARLLARAERFRHRRAWGKQGIALSHAIEAYMRALRGEEEGYVQTQLIVMTRLLRAVAAVATIDAQRQNMTFGANGRARR